MRARTGVAEAGHPFLAKRERGCLCGEASDGNRQSEQ